MRDRSFCQGGSFIDMPEMEPEILWSGREPKSNIHKFLQAEPSNVTLLLRPYTVIERWGLEIVLSSGTCRPRTDRRFDP